MSTAPATPSVSVTHSLVSILIPCAGQMEYTKLCVPSILKNTRDPFELIALDIGSLDGTSGYLAGIAAAARQRVEVVRTLTDLGLAQVIEDAVKLARGEYLVLLNNDTIVPSLWLTQLVALAQRIPEVGLIGPMSNYAAPPQVVERVPYRIRRRAADGLVDVSAVEEFAARLREENKGKWFEAERLGGFCLLVKREVLKRIGHLRESGDLGLFDTDSLCAKARQAGFELAVCKDLFVHHFGTRIFAHGAPAVSN